MIRDCLSGDFDAVLGIINDGAEAYRGIIPADRWREPYMDAAELKDEIAAGVTFRASDLDGAMAGVMGVQPVGDVTLIRHAYVRTPLQRRGIGASLLADALGLAAGGESQPMLVGTWAAAVWAVRFYQKHGFSLIAPQQKDDLLKTYWTIPDRQIETSVVLADASWFAGRGR